MASHDFIHLDSMQELADWNPELSFKHLTNISNTPLQRRPTLASGLPSVQASAVTVPRVLVCHDFKGGYHPSESSQGRCPFSDTVYTTEYLQYVSTFVYFSHKRVTIPPVSWINLMHRNGIKVLGTFLLENDDGKEEITRVLEKGSEGEFLFATQLARVAETYGFDGWLMNFESSFPTTKFSPLQVQNFLRELKSATHALVPQSEIIWYDALTILNEVHWQNGLTLLNAPFFAASDSLFTNYGWREPDLYHTAAMARAMFRISDIYAGIDCYGRGSLGDGGFGVGTALAVIRDHCLSAALFAPGWTFENFDGKDFQAIDKRFWLGDETSDPTAPRPLADYIEVKESGSEYYFYTNFNRGFGNALWLKGEKILDLPWVHLGTQSILPSYHHKRNDVLKWAYTSKLAYTGNWSLSITATLPEPLPEGNYPEFSCPLFKLGVKVTQELVIQFSYQLPVSIGETVGLYCNIITDQGEQRRQRYDLADAIPIEESGGWITAYSSVFPGFKDTIDCRVVEVGLFYRAPVTTSYTARTIVDPFPRPGIPIHVATLGELLFTTLDTEHENQGSSISSVIPTYTDGDNISAKLTWNVYAVSGSPIIQKKREQGMWSKTTKDFAWFVVWKGSEFVGVAHCCEFVCGDLIGSMGWGRGDFEAENVKWRVDGVTWEGAVFAGP
ncbi:uncharacterized protein LAJ45_10659 [Morchella importuna]|uniref:uncharacterized protein n=1 Tax=Morchella importuna TaxID=1174673 RepID=UPI001E8D3836|nr:uncharacterized protein LAJ45_10659 [Morchella importuna]KAH8145376.1 hypothetical protein LAJ45_10659 [Morchella importuna]